MAPKLKNNLKLLRPNVFVYHDYRIFLVEMFSFLKKSQKVSSLRKIGKDAGVSAAYISLILSGKRSLSEKLATPLASAIGLSQSEQKFFKQLVNLDEAPHQEDRLKAFQQIKRFSEYQSANENQIEAFRYMSEWYYVAIRELAAHPNFSDDPKWIQKQLIKHVPSSDIAKAIEFLLERGFLAKDSKGKFLQPNRNLDCHGGVYQISLNQFHKQILKLSDEMIDSLPKEKRNLTGYTFMMAESSYPEVTQILEDVKNKLKEIEDRDRAKNNVSKVYHVELVTIPLTGKNDESN